MRDVPLLLAVFVLVLNLACSREKSPTDPARMDAALVSKQSLYLSLQPTVADGEGFIDTAHCDSLLFTALTGVGGAPVHLLVARDHDFRWHRRPIYLAECFPAESATTISRDMLLGVMWYAFATHDVTLASDLWAYGSTRSWIMGDGDRGIVTLTPNMVTTLAQLVHYLGGAEHAERQIPIDFLWPKSLTGFEAHLEVLEILLRERIYATIEKSGVDALKAQSSRQPGNPLFSCAAGHVDQATTVLKDERYWPANRLPTSNDRCEGWLPQRDDGADWHPCPSDSPTTHSGGDFLFVAKLIAAGWCG